MTDTDLADALLRHPAIVALVGDRIALTELPQGDPLPALVYSLPSSTSAAYLAGRHEAGKRFMRLQLNPLALDAAGVNAVHAAAEDALAWRCAEEVAGLWLIHIEPGPSGIWSKDPTTGAWTRPRDYLIHFEA